MGLFTTKVATTLPPLYSYKISTQEIKIVIFLTNNRKYFGGCDGVKIGKLIADFTSVDATRVETYVRQLHMEAAASPSLQIYNNDKCEIFYIFLGEFFLNLLLEERRTF